MKVKAIVQSCGKGLVSAAVFAAGCALTTPSERFDAAARDAGLVASEVTGAAFSHRAYAAPRADAGAPGDDALYVYFGSDGTPFVDRHTVAADPTPRDPLTLALMARGPRPAVFLGRPCYHNRHGREPGCHPGLWTIGRYSEPVVASMTAATRQLLIEGGYRSAVLVGYSGGGVLALLVAERLAPVTAVVTLAANLDIGAWADLHGYSPLSTSVNPIDVAGQRSDLVHWHLTGENDRNVPPVLQERLMERLPDDAFRVVPDFDHRCCWVRDWPALLPDSTATHVNRRSAPH